MQHVNPRSFQPAPWLAPALGIIFILAAGALMATLGSFGVILVGGAACAALGTVAIFAKPFLGAIGLAIVYPMIELEYRGLPLPKIYSLALLTLLGLRFLYFESQGRSGQLLRLPLILPFAAVVGAGMLSALNSIDPYITLSRVLLQPAMMYITVLAVYNSITTRKQVQATMAVMIGLGVVSALIGWYNYATGNFQLISANLPRITPPAYLGGTHVIIAALLVVLLPMVLALALVTRRAWLRWLLLGCMGLFILTVMFTLSRAGWICLALQVPVWAWMLRRRPLLLGTAALFVLIATAVAAPAMWGLLTSFVRESSDEARNYLSELALDLFRQHPLIGVGFGTFTSYNGVIFDIYVFPPQPLDAHGMFDKIAAETGLIGLIAVGWLLSAISFRMWLGLRAARRDPAWHMIVFGLGLAFAVSTIFELSSVSFYSLQYWVPVGVALAAARLAFSDSAAHDQPPPGETPS
jgi:O-antigen ligase